MNPVQRQCLPAALAGDTLEYHLAQHSRRGRAIYLAVAMLVLLGCAALPLVKVSVSVLAPGIIRPETDKHEVRARVTGVAERVLVREGQEVRQGDTIAVLRSASLNDMASLFADQRAVMERERADLELLSGAGPDQPIESSRFQTPSLRQEYAQFVNELRDQSLVAQRAARELDRARTLYMDSVYSAAELEERQFSLDRARAASAAIVERSRAGWQGRLAAVGVELRTLRSRHEQLGEERGQYTVVAPATGTVEELESLSAGSVIQAGERIAIVSPSSRLLAEVWVAPRDIGLIRPGAPVRLLIDAFNHTDWGTVSGTVADVSSDFVEVDGRPMFRVRCAMDSNHLTLRNGFVGRLKKGMTLRSRFVVADRSLFQLLHDNVNDWVNPLSAPATSVAARN